LTAATTQDADVAITITGADPTVAELNTVAGLTTGAVTATISGNISTLASLSTGAADAITATVTDAVNLAQFNTLEGKTSANVVLTGGISDTAANLAPSGSASSGLTAATTQDADVAITITGTDPTVAELNKVAELTTGVVTATISGNISTLASLSTGAADAVTATVTDAVNVAQFNTLDGKTSVNVVLTGGVSDTAANLASSGTITSGLSNATTQDSDVVISVTDSSGSVAASDISAIGGAASGTVTVNNAITITRSVSDLTAALVTTSSKVSASTPIVTITEINGAEIGASNLSDIGGSTSGTVTVNGSIAISGTVAEVSAALVTAGSKVVLSSASATITATGVDTSSDLSSVTQGGDLTANLVNNANISSSNNLDEVDIFNLENNASVTMNVSQHARYAWIENERNYNVRCQRFWRRKSKPQIGPLAD
jgi:hypothetical protein